MNSGSGVCRLCVVGYPQPAGMRVYTHIDKIIPSSLNTTCKPSVNITYALVKSWIALKLVLFFTEVWVKKAEHGLKK